MRSFQGRLLRTGYYGMTVRRTSGDRQSPFSREGDIGFLTSVLSSLISIPLGLSTMLFLVFLPAVHYPLPRRNSLSVSDKLPINFRQFVFSILVRGICHF